MPRRQKPLADPLEDTEGLEGVELPGRMHDLADKPVRLPKKTRSGGGESYHPMHGTK